MAPKESHRNNTRESGYVMKKKRARSNLTGMNGDRGGRYERRWAGGIQSGVSSAVLSESLKMHFQRESQAPL